MADFTVQVRAVFILEVSVEADSMEDALALSKDWKTKDLVKEFDSATNVYDSSIQATSVSSDKAWSTE